MLVTVPIRGSIKQFSNIKTLYPLQVNTEIDYSDFLSGYNNTGVNLMDYINPDTANRETFGELRIDKINKSGETNGTGTNCSYLVFWPAGTILTSARSVSWSYTYYVYVLGDKYTAFIGGESLTAEQIIFINNAKLLYTLTVDMHAYNQYTAASGTLICDSKTSEVKFTNIVSVRSKANDNASNVYVYLYLTGNADGAAFTDANLLMGSISVYCSGAGYVEIYCPNPTNMLETDCSGLHEDVDLNSEFVKV